MLLQAEAVVLRHVPGSARRFDRARGRGDAGEYAHAEAQHSPNKSHFRKNHNPHCDAFFVIEHLHTRLTLSITIVG
jgi:hypothetical protein